MNKLKVSKRYDSDLSISEASQDSNEQPEAVRHPLINISYADVEIVPEPNEAGHHAHKKKNNLDYNWRLPQKKVYQSSVNCVPNDQMATMRESIKSKSRAIRAHFTIDASLTGKVRTRQNYKSSLQPSLMNSSTAPLTTI